MIDLASVHSQIEQQGGAFVPEMITLQGDFYDQRADVYDGQADIWAERKRKVDQIYDDVLSGLIGGKIEYLDFGCGTGTVTRDFVERIAPFAVVDKGHGIDISPEMCRRAGITLPNFDIRLGGVMAIDFEGLDLATAFFHTLGHLNEADVTRYFERAGKALRIGGVACFEVPKQLTVGEHGYNEENIANNDRYIAYYTHTKDGEVIRDQAGVPLIGSERMFTEDEVVKFARLGGLSVVTMQTIAVEHPNPLVGTINELVVVLQK